MACVYRAQRQAIGRESDRRREHGMGWDEFVSPEAVAGWRAKRFP